MTTKAHIRYTVLTPNGTFYALEKLAVGAYLATYHKRLVDGYMPIRVVRVFGNFTEMDADFELEVDDGKEPRPLPRMPLN